MQSDISEEKIRTALMNTMEKIQEIKERYEYITDSEEIAKHIQDECVIEVSTGVEGTSDYNKFKKYVETTIGESAWRKMTQNAQIFLITAELLYDQWKVYGDDNIDFAPICMSVSKALEVEVTRRYFMGYLTYLNENAMDIPAEMLMKENGEFREKREEEFMLGNITEVVEKVHTDVTEELDVVTEEDLPQKKTDNIPEWPDGILDYLDATERNKVLEYACNLQISQSTRLHKMLVQYKKDIADYKSE